MSLGRVRQSGLWRLSAVAQVQQQCRTAPVAWWPQCVLGGFTGVVDGAPRGAGAVEA